ncbi:MAG TPA: PadR family transcriptional regulator [Gemmatimonadaceae bacterium]|nr:PadR family transcriptional regulator [Gemmatimonadaceae bacterium]
MTVSVGDLELAALLAVVRLREHAYGARVRRDLSERAQRDYSIGAIYTTLQRLEDKGLVASTMSEPTAVRGGRAKRLFRVTGAGETVVRRARQEQAAFWRGVPSRLRTT